MGLSLSSLGVGLVAVAKAGAAKTLLPLIADFANSVAANPSQINIVAQVAKFQVGILSAFPALEQAEIMELATWVEQEAAALLAPTVQAVPLVQGAAAK